MALLVSLNVSQTKWAVLGQNKLQCGSDLLTIKNVTMQNKEGIGEKKTTNLHNQIHTL